MGNIGWTELLLIFLVVLLVFGAKRIPEIARGLGKGIREFKDATTDIKKELTVGDQPARQVGQAGYQGQPYQSQPGVHPSMTTYGPPPSPDQMGYVPPPVVPYTPPAPGQQPFPDPAAPPAPGTPPAAPPTEGQTQQS